MFGVEDPDAGGESEAGGVQRGLARSGGASELTCLLIGFAVRRP